MYLQEFLTLPSEDGQSASGPGNYSEGNKRYSWDTNRFIKTQAQCHGTEKISFLCSRRDLNRTVGLPAHSLVTVTEDCTQRFVSHICSRRFPVNTRKSQVKTLKVR